MRPLPIMNPSQSPNNSNFYLQKPPHYSIILLQAINKKVKIYRCVGMRESVENRLNQKQSLNDYNSIKYIAGILYPPILYTCILMAVQLAGNIYFTYVYSNQIGQDVTLGQSYEFLDNVQKLVSEHSYIFSFISGFIGLVVFMIIYEKDAKQYGSDGFVKQIQNIKPYRLGFLIILACMGNIGLSRLLSLLPLDNIVGSYEDTQELLLAGKLVIQIISVSIIIPITEELVYRGLVCERIKRLLGDKWAILLSAGLFALFHFNLLQGIYAFLIGLVLGYIYLKYNSILYCILLHGAANLTAVLVNYFNFSNYINRHIFLYLIVMIIELVIAGYAGYHIYKSED